MVPILGSVIKIGSTKKGGGVRTVAQTNHMQSNSLSSFGDPPDRVYCPSRVPLRTSRASTPFDVRRGPVALPRPLDTPANLRLVPLGADPSPLPPALEGSRPSTPSPEESFGTRSIAASSISMTVYSPLSNASLSQPWIVSPLQPNPAGVGRDSSATFRADYSVRCRRIGRVRAMDAEREARLLAQRAVALQLAAASLQSDEELARHDIERDGLQGLSLLHNQLVYTEMVLLNTHEEKQRFRIGTQQRMGRAALMERFANGVRLIQNFYVVRDDLVAASEAAMKRTLEERQRELDALRVDHWQGIYAARLRRIERIETESRDALRDNERQAEWLALCEAHSVSLLAARKATATREHKEARRAYVLDEASCRNRIVLEWWTQFCATQIDALVHLEALCRSLRSSSDISVMKRAAEQQWHAAKARLFDEASQQISLEYYRVRLAVSDAESRVRVEVIEEQFERVIIAADAALRGRRLRAAELESRTEVHFTVQFDTLIRDERKARYEALYTMERRGWNVIHQAMARLRVEIEEESHRLAFLLEERDVALRRAYLDYVRDRTCVACTDTGNDERRLRLAIERAEAQARHAAFFRLRSLVCQNRESAMRLELMRSKDEAVKIMKLQFVNGCLCIDCARLEDEESTNRRRLAQSEEPSARSTLRLKRDLSALELSEAETRRRMVTVQVDFFASLRQRHVDSVHLIRLSALVDEEIEKRRTVSNAAQRAFAAIAHQVEVEQVFINESHQRAALHEARLSFMQTTFERHVSLRTLQRSAIAQDEEASARRALDDEWRSGIWFIWLEQHTLMVCTSEAELRALLVAEASAVFLSIRDGATVSIHRIGRLSLNADEEAVRGDLSAAWFGGFISLRHALDILVLSDRETSARRRLADQSTDSMLQLWREHNARRDNINISQLLLEEASWRSTLNAEASVDLERLLAVVAEERLRATAAEICRALGYQLAALDMDEEPAARRSVHHSERLAFLGEFCLQWIVDLESCRRAAMCKAHTAFIVSQLVTTAEALERTYIASNAVKELAVIHTEATAAYDLILHNIRLAKLDEKARRYGKPFIGLTLAEKTQHFSRQVVSHPPLYIDAIFKDGPAYTCGLRLRDEILKVGDVDVTSLAHVRHMISQTTTVGGTVELLVRRYDRKAAASSPSEPPGQSSSFTVVVPVLTAEAEYRELPALFFDTAAHTKLTEE